MAMTAENESATPAPNDETKARFKEALERKQQAEHRTEEARRNTGNVHGSEVSGGGRRTFRRKTG
jgi:hypothetical protein